MMKVKINIQKLKDIIFYCLIFTSIIIRALLINYKPLWLDESVSILFGESNIKEVMNFIFNSPGSFPGHWIIIHPLLKLLKDAPPEISLRLPSLVADILAMLLFFRIVKKITGVKEAKLATLLYSIHPVLIWHSLDGRVYSIFLLLCLLSIYLLINIKEKKKGFLLWYLVTGIIPYFHFYGYFFIFLLIIILYTFFPTLIAESRRQLFQKISPIILILLPSFFLFYKQAQSVNIVSLVLKEHGLKDTLMLTILSILGNFHQEYIGFFIYSLILFFFILVTFCAFSNDRFRMHYLIIFSLILLLPSLPHDLFQIFFHPRYIIFSIPFFIFVFVDCIFKSKHKILKFLLLSVFILNNLLVNYLSLSARTSAVRPFSKADLQNINSMTGSFLFLPGYFAFIFKTYNLLENRTIFLCIPDFINKNELSLFTGHIRKNTTFLYLIPKDCKELKDALQKEMTVTLIYSPILKTKELMSNCIKDVTGSFKITSVNQLTSGITIIRLQNPTSEFFDKDKINR